MTVTRSLTQPLTRPLAAAVTQGVGGGFSPVSLFSASQDGGVFDWSDATTTYQDSAGTTAGVVGQVDGLTLDERLGLARGAELGTNGTFVDGVSGWDQYPGLAFDTFGVVGNELRFVSDGSTRCLAGQAAASAFPVVAGATYLVMLTIRVVSGVSAAVRLSQSYHGSALDGGVSIASAKAPGTHVVVRHVVASATANAHLTFDQNIATPGDYYISNVSIKSLAGNHAVQATTASKPLLQAGYASFDAFDDFMTAAAGGGGTAGILLCAGIRAGGAGTARTIWSDRGTNTGYRLSLNTSNQLILSAGNGASHTAVTGPAITAGTDYVVMGWHDGTNLNVRVGLAAATSAAFATATAGTAGFTIGRDNGTAAGLYGDRIYCLTYRKNDTSTASERDSLTRWTATKSSITL